MSKEKITKGIDDVLSAQEDLKKCEEYEKKIYEGKNVIQEANAFAVNKVIEISGKSPEIIIKNGVVANCDPITAQTALNSLAIAKNVINDQLIKDSKDLTKESIKELNKNNLNNTGL